MIRFECPKCGKGITAPERVAGKRAKCPGCQAVLTVPEAAESDHEVYTDFEVVDDDAPVTAKPSPVTAKPRQAAAQEIPTVEAVDDDEGERPRRRSRRDDDDDDDEDYDDDDERPRRKKRRKRYTASSGTPIGRTGYAVCYSCGADDANKVRWTIWGGLIGPAMISHVKCGRCDTTYNGSSGKSNNTAIAIYMGAGFGIALLVAVFAIINAAANH